MALETLLGPHLTHRRVFEEAAQRFPSIFHRYEPSPGFEVLSNQEVRQWLDTTTDVNQHGAGFVQYHAVRKGFGVEMSEKVSMAVQVSPLVFGSGFMLNPFGSG